MRPVNLLPAGARRGGAGGRTGRGPYALLGGLAALLLVVLFSVLTANVATERRNEANRLNAESDRLEAQAKGTSPGADLAALRRQRTDGVRAVAAARLDWERFVRETGRLLPRAVWLTTLDGSTAAADPAAGGAAPAAAAAGAAGAPPGPSVALSGCAPDHRRVADTLVRLRRLHGATDVELEESVREEAAVSGGAGVPAPAGGGAQAAGGCGTTGGRPNVNFKVIVRLEQPAAQPATETVQDRVPQHLGGGQ